MKIRNSGGAGQAWRARFFGAIPNTTAWPNVPLALSQGTFDGFVSPNESLRQRQAMGCRRQVFARRTTSSSAEYIPLISQVFWDKLAPEQQKMMTELWAQNIADLPRQHGRRADQGPHHA